MSTYSTNLALELIADGDQTGTWGTTTNTNLGTLIEQAISGYVTYACTGGTDTITIPNGTSGTARNMYLELTGAGGGTLVVPANKKLYFIYNNTSASAAAVTVKVSGQTGVSVPAGKKMILVSNGTDIVDATNYVTSLAAGALTVSGAVTLTTPLSAANGGTGLSSPGTTGNILTSTGTGWQSSAASTFVSSVTATSPLSSSGGNTPDISIGSTIPVNLGGSGVASHTAYALLAGGTTSTGAVQSLSGVGTSGQVLTSNGAGALPSFQAVGVGGGTEYKTSGSGTWTIPAGVTTVTVTVLGPGANGGRGQYASTGGGGAGGLAIKTLTGLTPGNTLSYVVGTTTGGVNSTVSSGSQTISTVTGGYGAQPGDSSSTGGTGGTASGGDLNIPGQKGYDYEATGSQYDCAGGSPGGGFGFGGLVNGSTGTYGNGATGYGAGGGGNNAGATGVVRGGNGTAGLIIFQY